MLRNVIKQRNEKNLSNSIIIIYMKNISQRTLEYNIELVKWENYKYEDEFPLLTVHSLLIDKNHKFVQLKQIVHDYNQSLHQKPIQRPIFRRSFVQRLFEMLCKLVQVPNSENQLDFLNKIYDWAFSGNDNDFPQQDFDFNPNYQKEKRPTTASTRTRPYSAHTNKARPPSGHQLPLAKKEMAPKIPREVKEQYPNVDFTQLQKGENEFFVGWRTLHPEEQKPKAKLKQYHRKIFYDEIEDDFEEFIEQVQEQEPKKQIIKQIPKEEELPLEEKPEDENAEGEEGVEGEVPVGEEDVNIDDLVGDEEEVPEEEAEVIDKLKPKVPVYVKKKELQKGEVKKLYKGIHNEHENRNDVLQKNVETEEWNSWMQQWGMGKSRNKSQMKRRSEQKRMLTQKVGITKLSKKKTQQPAQRDAQIYDFADQEPSQLKSNIRPKTAMTANSKRVKDQAIKDAFVTGKLQTHIPQPEEEIPKEIHHKMSVYPQNPRKKTFEQILREAEEKVTIDGELDTLAVKSKLIENKVAITANRVAKSLTYDENLLDEREFVGEITGAGMAKNPFFKVAKKKKKKKKK